MLVHNPTRHLPRKRFNARSKLLLLLNMPTEVILSISDHLDVLDRAALALSCKELASKLVAYSQLEWDGITAYLPSNPEPSATDPLLQFFGERLTNGWIPSCLKYCKNCGKYGPRDDLEYWFERLASDFGGKRGSMSQFIEKEFLIQCKFNAHLGQIWDIWQTLVDDTCPRCQALFAFWRQGCHTT